MFETSRRSKISTSELGLYSDRSERSHCHTSGYGTVVVKQFVVVVMIIITVLLVSKNSKFFNSTFLLLQFFSI